MQSLGVVGACRLKSASGDLVLPHGAYTLVCVFSGSLDAFYGTERQCLFAPSYIIVPPDGEGCLAVSDGSDVFTVSFVGEYVPELMKNAGTETGKVCRFDTESAEPTADAIIRESAEADVCSPVARCALLSRLLVLCGRMKNEKRQRGGGLEISEEYIAKNFHSDIDCESLAALEGISLSYYRMLFRRLHGCSPNEYIMMLRIGYAKELLTDTSLAVNKIAYEAGFRDQSYFSRLFRIKTGISPAEYRKLNSKAKKNGG